MAINLTSTSSILGSQLGRNSGKISELSSKLQDATKAASSGAASKYDSRVGLETDGLGDIYDRTQRTLLIAESSKVNVDITFAKLSNDARALQEINDAVVQFQVELSSSSETIGTDLDIADRALVKIERVLSMQDGSGRYVFGGNDPYTNPLTKVDANGNFVKVNLTETTNLVEKLVTNNYASDAGPNETVVTLSSRHETKESFLYPGMGALADTIAYINMHKAPEGTYTSVELDAARQKQIDSRGEVDILVKLEVEKTEAAREVNKLDIQKATDTNTALFQGDLVEAAGLVQNLIQSLLANVTLNQVSNNTFNTLLERTRV
ncbi:MAG: hypothetical protein NWS20_02610 [Rickettsiaceae bacterium]|nr:hypothetical protein [Rickettsiaceae bacterium]MDP4832530.1 hypothetical protein [Rickettsiaceae bacterium]MDP5020228.1 hypothetical protein [Rickettsiaceae bacterium]MDP5083503.1 hypothetical protein [Rickettsiaceae bacterium]